MVLPQAGRLDLDEPLAVVGLVEGQDVEADPVPARLGHPLDLRRQVVPLVVEQPPLLDLDGELLAELAQVPVHGVTPGEVDLLALPGQPGFSSLLGTMI